MGWLDMTQEERQEEILRRYGQPFKQQQTAVNVRRGTAHYCAKLTEDNVRDIWKLFKAGITRAEIARRYSVTEGTIANIIKGHGWRHVLLEGVK